MTRPWLAIVGIGEDGLEGVAPAGRRLIDDAEILVGGARHLAMIPEDGRERHAWPSPLSALVEQIVAWRGRPVCVLATGDPMWFGIGTTLVRHVPEDERIILPAPSAFSLACSRLGWPLDTVETVTLHGRPTALLTRFVYPGARVLALAHDRATPGEVAALLQRLGYGRSRLTILEHMGGADERRLEAVAAEFDAEVADFHTIAIACEAGPEARVHSRLAGLPDEAFRHDGKMTKREARAAALAKLAPVPGALLWDIGAGAGSIAIEWMRAAPGMGAIALEPRPERRALIADNAAALGVPDLAIVEGRAPEALAHLEPPDAVFLGGGISPETIAAAFAALRPGGRLVAHAVTLESEAVLLAAFGEHGGELTRIAVSRAEPVGPYFGWRALMPVTQWSLLKP